MALSLMESRHASSPSILKSELTDPKRGKIARMAQTDLTHLGILPASAFRATVTTGAQAATGCCGGLAATGCCGAMNCPSCSARRSQAAVGADAVVVAPTAETEGWFASPARFFATLGAGIAVGYLIGRK